MWRARARRLVGAFRRWPVAVLAAALIVLAVMYGVNDDMSRQPDAPRGNGQYLPVLARGDGHIYWLTLMSLGLDGDLVLDDELRAFGDPWRQPISATGRKYFAHPVGPALVWMPAFWVAHGTAKVANLFGADIPEHGYTAWHQRIVLFTSVVLAWLAAVCGFLVARKWIGGRWGPLYAAVAVLYGTSLTYYATFMPGYPHAMDAGACGVFVAVWALGYGDLRWRRFVILGIPLGIAGLIRTQELAMGVALAVELIALAVRPAPELRADRRAWARHAGMLALRGATTLGVALLFLIPQLLAWHAVTGDWIHQAHGPGYVRYGDPQILELLFAQQNGWLSTTPIAYFAVIGLFLVPKRARVVALGLVAALALQVYLSATIMDWWSSASFGQRRMCSVTAILVVGLAALLRLASLGAARIRIPVLARHAIAAVVLGWFVIWNVWSAMDLMHGKAAGRVAGGPPFYDVPDFQKAIAEPIQKRWGNPFAFPANVLFAWRHDVPIRRWDQVAGVYAYSPPLDQYRTGVYRRQRAAWNLPGQTRFLVSGWGPLGRVAADKEKGIAARAWRPTTTPRAVALVPILLPEAHRFTLAVEPIAGAPEVTIRWNDTVRARQTLRPGWNDVVFDVPADDVDVGVNTLAIDAPPGSVNVGALSLGFPQ